ncbi:response regulator, partial [Scytonema sp. NUACC26]|uniref:response regulator n=1 Tax=Scytonema sp. NUACC26 TaxID=3140176 RepID=UPI0038B35295
MSGNYLTQDNTILIVDDTPTNLQVLFDLLSEQGYRVAIAKSGETALQRLQISKPNLILLDVMMPGIDGFETCQRLKANPSTREIPVIFMTALSDSVDKVKGLSLGAVDYITKPIQHEEALARIRVHLQLRNTICVMEQRTDEL